MKKQLLLLSIILLGLGNFQAKSQTVIYSEDFTTGATWTINTTTGPEGANANVWYISCQEDGQPVAACGTACIINDNSLHVSTFAGDLGAAYLEIGTGQTTTERRAESGDISTVGQTNLTLNFDMIGDGGNPNDYTEVFYSINGGAAWISLATPLTSLCCGSVVCTGTEQGLWQNNTYALPATCENIANLRISFVWKNLDDGIATDPSFAVDDIEITTPSVGGPTADFSASLVTICEGDCIDFTDLTAGFGANPTWDWTFTGAVTTTSAIQNPTGICYNTAGSYQVELTVNDDGGVPDTETKVAYITVNAPPVAGSDVSVNACDDATIDLNGELIGAGVGGTWLETSGTPSGQFTPGTGVLDGNGLAIGNVYTFTYTVTGVAPCVGNDVATITVTIVDCGILTPAFTPSATSICVGDCLTFTDNSTGPITTWDWTFASANTPTASGQDPGSICWSTPGTFDVVLTIGDGTSTAPTTVQITVNDNPTVTATAVTNDTICVGDMVTLTGGGADTYVWDNSVTDGVAFAPTATTSYTVTGTDVNGCVRDFVIEVVVEVCDSLIPGFSYPDNICLTDCITFTDTSSGNISAWAWDFGGGGTPNTSTEQNPTVCFDVPGTYNVQLTLTDVLGANASTTNSISVFNSPLVSAALDTIIELGGTATLIAVGSGPGDFYWTPSDVDCDTCTITSASPWVNTDYVVTLTDINGCASEDTVHVLVNFIEGIGVPTAFSPNGDGGNDVLYVKGFGIDAMTFEVYNRYGQKVFETLTQDIGWDGTFKGRDENSGVFTWVLEYNLVNGSSGILKGNTTLIR